MNDTHYSRSCYDTGMTYMCSYYQRSWKSDFSDVAKAGNEWLKAANGIDKDVA